MITVLESIKLSTQYLHEKGIDSPRVNAELLLADILKCKRLDLYLLFDRPLTELELNQYREYLKRRGNFEPLQYILGKVEFFGLEIIVNDSVLIPRPETELLVEKIINDYKSNLNLTILDIGCGSGNISIALAVNLKSARIFTTDVKISSLEVAKENARLHRVEKKINFINHNILEQGLDEFEKFDIVVSNPPYVSKENYSTLQKEVKDFEPITAVTDGNDGLTFFKAICEKTVNKFKPNGKLYFEIAEGQMDDVQKIMKHYNFVNISTVKDYQNIHRIVYGEMK